MNLKSQNLLIKVTGESSQ